MNLLIDPEPDYRGPAVLMDNDGQALGNVHVNLSPMLGSGDFRLPASANAERILNAALLQTDDGKKFRISGLKLCPGYHTIAPDQPHYEFHYQPV